MTGGRLLSGAAAFAGMWRAIPMLRPLELAARTMGAYCASSASTSFSFAFDRASSAPLLTDRHEAASRLGQSGAAQRVELSATGDRRAERSA